MQIQKNNLMMRRAGLSGPDLLHLQGGHCACAHLRRLYALVDLAVTNTKYKYKAQIQIQNDENQFCRVNPHEEADLLKVVVEVSQVLARQDRLRTSWTLKLHFEF